ncbi:MAG TPA: hypothetical protein ENN08_02355 [Bacteroidales bacterium]|nr:hypothetical protein [Bacteroidales bacterium]
MPAKKHNKTKAGFLSRFILVLNVLMVLVLLSCYAASRISPNTFWPAVFLNLAYPAILLINVLFIIFWLLRLRAWFLLSLITVLLGWSHVKAYIKFSGNNKVPAHMNSISVMSFNVRFFDRYSWVNTKKVETRNKIFELIDRENPAIICFQEFYSDLTQNFNTVKALAADHGYVHYHTAYALVQKGNRSYGIATFSKHPIIRRDSYRFTNNIYNFAVISDIVVEPDTFRVFNVHFESIRMSNEDRLFINDLRRQVGSQDIAVENYKRIFGKIRSAAALRSSQAREIRELIESSPYPVILCTDLNDTPSSFAYRQLTASLNDAFVESGRGLGNTYIGFLPAFRIDFILYDPFFESTKYRTLPDQLSDHYPVITKLLY